MRSRDRRAVAARWAISWGPIGNWLVIDWRLFLERMFTTTTKVYDCLETSQQLIGDRSVISRRLKTVLGLSTTSAPTSRWPVPDLLVTAKNLSTVDLVAERFHLQQAKPGCDQIIFATFLWLLQPVGNLFATPATSLQPPEIMVARRSPTGCKLCVTGA